MTAAQNFKTITRINAQIVDLDKCGTGQIITPASSVIFHTTDSDGADTVVATWNLSGFHGEGEFFNKYLSDPEVDFDYDSAVERLIQDMNRHAAEIASDVGRVISGQDSGESQFFWTVAEPTPIQRLKRMHDLRMDIDGAEAAVVDASRQAGSTWQEIGDALGISRQSANARFGK